MGLEKINDLLTRQMEIELITAHVEGLGALENEQEKIAAELHSILQEFEESDYGFQYTLDRVMRWVYWAYKNEGISYPNALKEASRIFGIGLNILQQDAARRRAYWKNV